MLCFHPAGVGLDLESRVPEAGVDMPEELSDLVSTSGGNVIRKLGAQDHLVRRLEMGGARELVVAAGPSSREHGPPIGVHGGPDEPHGQSGLFHDLLQGRRRVWYRLRWSPMERGGQEGRYVMQCDGERPQLVTVLKFRDQALRKATCSRRGPPNVPAMHAVVSAS